jgi:ubiquitin C-terminal hydrolase
MLQSRRRQQEQVIKSRKAEKTTQRIPSWSLIGGSIAVGSAALYLLSRMWDIERTTTIVRRKRRKAQPLSGPGSTDTSNDNNTTNDNNRASSSSSSSSRSDQVAQVDGYRNLGNTCYMNSLLQALENLPVFQLYAQQLYRLHPKSQFLQSFVDTIRLETLDAASESDRRLRRGGMTQRVKSPRAFHTLFTRQARMFQGFAQHDAHELFNVLLEILQRTQNSVKSFAFHQSMTPGHSHSHSHSHSGGHNKPDVLYAAPISDAKTIATEFHSSIDRSKKLLQAVEDPFEGMTANFLHCTACGFKFDVRHSIFKSVSLAFPMAYLQGRVASRPLPLTTLLQDYTVNELLEGVNCPACINAHTLALLRKHLAVAERNKSDMILRSRYQKRIQQLQMFLQVHGLTPPLNVSLLNDVDAPTLANLDTFEVRVRRAVRKKVMFARLPQIMCLHLARLVGDIKIRQLVDFPMVLDLARQTAAFDEYASNRTPAHHQSRSQSQQQFDPEHASPDTIYVLSAVIVHLGGAFSGHFTAYRRVYPVLGVNKSHVVSSTPAADTKSGHHVSYTDAVTNAHKLTDESRWVHISDENVSRVAATQTLRAEAYMLMYEQLYPADGRSRHVA